MWPAGVWRCGWPHRREGPLKAALRRERPSCRSTGQQLDPLVAVVVKPSRTRAISPSRRASPRRRPGSARGLRRSRRGGHRAGELGRNRVEVSTLTTDRNGADLCLAVRLPAPTTKAARGGHRFLRRRHYGQLEVRSTVSDVIRMPGATRQALARDKAMAEGSRLEDGFRPRARYQPRAARRAIRLGRRGREARCLARRPLRRPRRR